MPDWDKAPVTKAALWTSTEERGPSALEREWAGQLRNEGDFILLIAGCCKRLGSTGTWTALWWNVSAEDGDPDAQRAAALSDSPTAVERFLAPFSRETRVRIMQELWRGARSADDLSEAAGVKGGALHSHLDDLMQAGLVAKEPNGAYSLTGLGCNLLLTITELAGITVEDRGADGLVMGDLR